MHRYSHSDSVRFLDVRDYNVSYKNPIAGSTNIPIAYLKRYCDEVPDCEIHVVASNQLEKNFSVRFLRKQGFRVTGYSLTDCKCRQAVNYKTA